MASSVKRQQREIDAAERLDKTSDGSIYARQRDATRQFWDNIAKRNTDNAKNDAEFVKTKFRR